MLSLIKIPTPPEPLQALLESDLLLFPNHLKPGMSNSCSPTKKVSLTHTISSSRALIILVLNRCEGSDPHPRTFQDPSLMTLVVGWGLSEKTECYGQREGEFGVGQLERGAVPCKEAD